MLKLVAAGLMVGAAGAAGVAGAPSSAQPPSTPAFPLVELRQYRLHPGQRDVMIALFDRELVESQEATGMKVIGQFRDLDDPDRFVWLRGFRDMESRAAGLSAFYSEGPVWRAHRAAANATMIDSDNVLLLRAPEADAVLPAQPPRPPADAAAPASDAIVVATIYHLRADPAEAAPFFAAEMKPRLEAAGLPVLGWFVPETRANNFPRLPVREGERVLVWFARFASPAEHRRTADALARSPRWTEIAPRLEAMLARPPEVLRLQPTARSELR